MTHSRLAMAVSTISCCAAGGNSDASRLPRLLASVRTPQPSDRQLPRIGLLDVIETGDHRLHDRRDACADFRVGMAGDVDYRAAILADVIAVDIDADHSPAGT